ncbi:putative U2 small nuclear ribonucleoprotein B''-like [Capsicum annuum]|nr:putative U2 small nuclear ribonucleoprotein B''-like [Capsicum annuum]
MSIAVWQQISLFRFEVESCRFDERTLRILESILASIDFKSVEGVVCTLKQFMRHESLRIIEEIAGKSVEHKLLIVDFLVHVFALIGDTEIQIFFKFLKDFLSQDLKVQVMTNGVEMGGGSISSARAVTAMDYNHALFLSPSDVSGTQIISFQLTGGIMYASVASVVWNELLERFNKVDGARTFNLHKEIATLSQRTASVSCYFSKLKDLWEEFEALVPAPGCDCEKSKEFVLHLQKLKLFQFLMGLNETYTQARSQILLMAPLPTVNQAYAMIMSDESQKSIATNAGVLRSGPTGIGRSLDLAMFTRNGTQKFKKNYNLQCDFLYKVTSDSQDTTEMTTRQGSHSRSIQSNWFNDGCHQEESEMQLDQLGQMGITAFTKEQYDQILKLINKNSGASTSTETTNAANAGISVFLASYESRNWIIDTSATNHMVGKLDLLVNESIAKLVNFFPDFCAFLCTRKVRGIGKLDGGLYLLVNTQERKSCLALRYEALLMREQKASCDQRFLVSYSEWLTFAEHSLESGYCSVAKKACEKALLCFEMNIIDDPANDFVIEKIKKLKDVAVISASSKSVQAQAAAYFNNKSIQQSSQGSYISVEPKSSGSTLFKDGIKRRHKRQLDEYRHLKLDKITSGGAQNILVWSFCQYHSFSSPQSKKDLI